MKRNFEYQLYCESRKYIDVIVE